jgi:hypothetical protein
MASKKYDGIIEAVRYSPTGKIELVRAYERRGSIWSDCVLLDREQLTERLTHGKKFMTGERKNYLGSVFEAGVSLRQMDGSIVTEEKLSGRDLLGGVPTF